MLIFWTLMAKGSVGWKVMATRGRREEFWEEIQWYREVTFSYNLEPAC